MQLMPKSVQHDTTTTGTDMEPQNYNYMLAFDTSSDELQVTVGMHIT